MSGWLKSVIKSVLNTGLKLAEIILNHINLLVLLIVIMLNIGIAAMKIKVYQLKNTLKKLGFI